MSTSKRPALGFIFVTLLIDVTGFGIVIPVMPSLIEKLGKVNASEAASIGGWLLFTYALVQFLFAPILGGLSDRYGRRPILLGSLFGFGIDYLLTAFAPTLSLLFVGRFIAGIMGSSFTTGAAYIADISTPEKRAQNFGMIGAAFGLGFIIGPVIGGALGQFGPQIPFLPPLLWHCSTGSTVILYCLNRSARKTADHSTGNAPTRSAPCCACAAIRSF